jgi:hypothetical protein
MVAIGVKLDYSSASVAERGLDNDRDVHKPQIGYAGTVDGGHPGFDPPDSRRVWPRRVGHCGRRLRTHYRGHRVSPGYHCAGKNVINGRGVYYLIVGGLQINQAVAQAFLKALQPAGLAAAERLEADREGALAQWGLAVERTQYEAARAERPYSAVEPATAW